MGTKKHAAFGENLKKYREEAELTQEKLGVALGFTAGYISALETGRKTPAYDTAIRLSEILGISMDQLSFDRDSGKDDPIIQDILMYRSKMSDKRKRLADHLGRNLYAELAEMEDD